MSHPFRPCIILLLLVNGFQVTSLLIKCSRAVSFLSLLLGSLCLFPKRITTASGATPTHASIISAHTIWTEPLLGWRISIRIFCFFEMMTGVQIPSVIFLRCRYHQFASRYWTPCENATSSKKSMKRPRMLGKGQGWTFMDRAGDLTTTEESTKKPTMAFLKSLIF